jgi:hypothetical protein
MLTAAAALREAMSMRAQRKPKAAIERSHGVKRGNSYTLVLTRPTPAAVVTAQA